MARAGMQSRAVEGVGMVIGKRAAARGSARDAEEAGTRLSRIESNKKRKSDFSREALPLYRLGRIF